MLNQQSPLSFSLKTKKMSTNVANLALAIPILRVFLDLRGRNLKKPWWQYLNEAQFRKKIGFPICLVQGKNLEPMQVEIKK